MILINVLIVLLLILIIFYLSGLFMRFLSYLGLRTREAVEGFEVEGFEVEGFEVEGSKDTKDTIDSKAADKKTYKDPNLNENPLYLATLNAANISYLKDQVDILNGLKQQVTTLQSQVDNNSTALTALGEQFNTSSQQLTGRDPDSKEPLPIATGLE